ncbi:MAG TPA: tyrosine-type recombinase/integrase, partial [Actinomycetota bacterium]|nr:tyrosine-type recombinase/integrase [Actinomycetota bacterium]
SNLLRAERDEAAGEFVFEAPRGGFLRYHSFRPRFWNPAVEASGLGAVTPHELRHSHVAMLIRQGWTEHEIVVRMGWTSSTMLHSVYGHLFEDHQRDRVAKLGGEIYGEPMFGDAEPNASSARPAVSQLPTVRVADAR